jgi:hypothetical protein
LHGTPSPASMVTNILNCTIETNKITHLDWEFNGCMFGWFD